MRTISCRQYRSIFISTCPKTNPRATTRQSFRTSPSTSMDAKSTEPSTVAGTLGNLAALSFTLRRTTDVPTPSVASILLAMREFDACISYLNTRRSAGAIINIESEADVQDVLYLLLRPWIIDLVYESPGDKAANCFVIKDFSSASGRFGLVPIFGTKS